MQQRKATHGSARVRVVVETDDPALAICDFETFADAGFDVVVCGGPAEGSPCPAIDGQPCPAIGEADVVLNTFSDPALRQVVAESVRELAPDVGMVVITPAGSSDDLPEGCIALSEVASVPGQIAALRRAAFSAPRAP